MIPTDDTLPKPRRTRIRRRDVDERPSPPLPALPQWIQPSGPVERLEDAAVLAGAALHALDQIVRMEPVWAGVWRQRQALSCAVAAVRLAGRPEDEAALRDAWCLRRPGDEVGPAGNIYAVWKRLPTRAPSMDSAMLREVAGLLSIRWSEALADIPVWLDELMQGGRSAPFVAAAMVQRLYSARPDAELLAWWCADIALAHGLRWKQAVPLLMAERHGTAFRSIGGRGRIRPGDPAFERAVLLALVLASAEAYRRAADLDRRAAKLAAVSPLLRAKGAGDALVMLLDDDAVSGSLVTPRLTRWASRRLFERLTELGAVRELSGRSTFRLYGL